MLVQSVTEESYFNTANMILIVKLKIYSKHLVLKYIASCLRLDI